MSEAWEDEGFGAENDWGDESVESDLEEDEVLQSDELEDDTAWEDATADESDDEQ